MVSLPVEEMCNMAHSIKVLYINRNQLLELPSAFIRCCTALQTLYCGNNQMTALPADLGACAKLRSLYCSRNQLLSLPKELGACAKMETLECTDNRLSSLPVELGAYTRMRLLCCRDNPFVSGAPTTIAELRKRLQLRRTCTSLVFCHEATQRRDDEVSAQARLGDIARDNICDIMRILSQ